MGVHGMSTFMKKSGFFEDHRLHDTVLLIDGSNFKFRQFFYEQQKHNDHMFGGDYSSLLIAVKNFFQKFQKCNVLPIIIFDGSIDPNLEKFETMLQRNQDSLNTAHKIYNNNFYIEGILPLLLESVFCLTLEELQIPIYQTYYEADKIMVQIAYDLICPILSNDSDFFLYNLPGGFIHLDSLFQYDCIINYENYYYMKCHYYQITNLKRSFPTLNLDLVQIIGFLLGNDYVEQTIIRMLLQKRVPKNTKIIIYEVFKWLSKHDSLQSLLDTLAYLLSDPQHELIKMIQKHFVIFKKCNQQFINPETYFKNNMDELFFKYAADIPVWVRSLYVKRKFPRQLLSISKSHIDWCRPLVEDFSYIESSYQICYELFKYIYGLLRTCDENIAKIKRYSRKKTKIKCEMLTPKITLDGELLPKLIEIEYLNLEKRKKLFFRILNIEDNILNKIGEYFNLPQTDNLFNRSLLIPFSSMILILIYLLRNFADYVWIEFIYAVYMNIWLTGYLDSNDYGQKFLKLDSDFEKIIQHNLSRLNLLPVFSSSKVYMPRIVHFYNAFQVCISNIGFLSNILNLDNIFSINLICSLKGTFIYNLTTDLSSRPKPFLYIQELLERRKFKALNFFIKLLNYVFENSDRSLLAKNETLDDKNIIPDSLRMKLDFFGCQQKKKYLVRGFDVTKKKTHIKSQRMKLKN